MPTVSESAWIVSLIGSVTVTEVKDGWTVEFSASLDEITDALGEAGEFDDADEVTEEILQVVERAADRVRRLASVTTFVPNIR